MAEQESQSARLNVPTNGFLRDLARDEIRQALEQHVAVCPVREIEQRVRTLEIRFGLLIGFMGGAGFFGGMSGALIAKFLGG